MPGKKFLNPVLKIVLCCAGMLTMGYFLYVSLEHGTISEHINIVRALVFLGFGYLLVQSIRDLLSGFRH